MFHTLAKYCHRAAAFAGVVCACSLAAPVAAQQTATITGKVISTETAIPLPDVFIQLDGSQKGVYTDAQGRFRLSAVKPGKHVVIAQRVGLEGARRTVDATANQTATLSFTLGEAASLMEPLVITASREAEHNKSAERVDALGGAEVRLARATHPNQIMNRIAGVHVSDLSGEGHSMAIRQPITTKPMYLYLEDGVPTRPTGFFNHNALYEVNIPQSGGIEVLKGPGTALYGSDAIGGVVNVLTRPAPATPTLETSVEGGAFGYGRLLMSGGTTAGNQGVRADVNVTRSDNWKQNAPFQRQSGTVRYDVFNLAGWQVRTVLTGSRINQYDVPTIGSAQYNSDPTLNLAPNVAYRKVRAVRLTSAFEKQSGASLWSFTPFARYNLMLLLPSWQLTYDPQTWNTRNNSIGMLAKYRHDFAPLNARVITGVDVDYSPGGFTANQAIVSPVNKVYASYSEGPLQYDYDVTYHQVSPYVQTEINPTSRLKVEAGLREDLTGYVYTNHLSVLNTGSHRRPADTSVDYTHLSPKVGATYQIMSGAMAFVSYRNGFRAPSQSQLFQQNSADNTVGLSPVKVDSYEGGLRGQIGSRFVYQVSAYDMTIRDDIITFVTAQNTREATNAGKTRHKGIEGTVGVAVLPSLRIDGSYSRASQRYVEWIPQAARPGVAGIDYSGNLIEQAPRDLASALVTFSPRLLKGGRVALEWTHTGRYAADPANTFFYNGYNVVNMQANALLTPKVEFFARMQNLTDAHYAELVAYDTFQKDQYTPGAPRALFAGFRYTLQ